MEVAGLGIGLPPLIALTLKSYRQTLETFRTFRHRHEEIEVLQRQFKIQKRVFKNECLLLILWTIKNESLAERLVNDISSDLWQSNLIKDLAQQSLGSSHEEYKAAVHAVAHALQKVEADLRKYDAMASRHGGDRRATVSNSLRRIGPALSVPFQKSRYEKNIADLQAQNRNLRTICSQLREIEKQRRGYSHTSVLVPIPARYTDIRAVSVSFHDNLQTAWCCRKESHSKHYARLCIDSNEEDNLRLEFALSFEEGQGTAAESSRAPHASPIWFHVLSQSVSGDLIREASTAASSRDLMGSVRSSERDYVEIGSGNDLECMSSTFQTAQNINKRRKTGEGQTLTITSEQLPNPPAPPSPQTSNARVTGLRNLYQVRSLCDQLTTSRVSAGRRIGSLDSPQYFNHVLFSAQRHRAASDHDELRSLKDALSTGLRDTISMINQLKIAHRIAKAVLQLNTTPWLGQTWHLDDFSFFSKGMQVCEDDLETLYLSSPLGKSKLKGKEKASGRVPITTNQDPSQEEMIQIYGVNNLPLFNLGAALIQIGHWQPLNDIRDYGDCLPFVKARKLSYCNSPLGPRYQRIIRRCIQCNFGCDNNMATLELQSAVYRDVVCELEQMVKSLTI